MNAKAWFSGILTYGGLGWIWYETNWKVALAVFLVNWGFIVWNKEDELDW